MPKYKVTVEFEFHGVEAKDHEEARAMCDTAVGTVIVEHPTTGEKVSSECRASEEG